MFESYKPESPDDKKEQEFAEFVSKEGFSSSEVKEAYYRFLGVSEHEVEADERIQVLVDKMNEFARGHYPINRFATLVEVLQEVDHAAYSYDDFVDNLQISEREKRVLHSIVEEKREGVLECYVDENLVKRIHIENQTHESLFKTALLELLQEVVANAGEGDELSFLFED